MRNSVGCIYPGNHSLQLMEAIEIEQEVNSSAGGLVPAEVFAVG